MEGEVKAARRRANGTRELQWPLVQGVVKRDGIVPVQMRTSDITVWGAVVAFVRAGIWYVC